MVRMMEGITAKIAAEGNAVVVGRGAPTSCGNAADTFRVFLVRAASEKMRRLVGSGTHPQEKRKSLVDNVDRERMAFIKHYFNADWPTRCLYHVMINTSIGDDM